MLCIKAIIHLTVMYSSVVHYNLFFHTCILEPWKTELRSVDIKPVVTQIHLKQKAVYRSSISAISLKVNVVKELLPLKLSNIP
jgi:hypothetical protein